MILEQKRTDLKLDYQKLGLTPGVNSPYYKEFILKNDTSAERHPCIIVCPGGGYHFTADREAEPIALQFVATGFSAFILHYSVTPARFPCSLIELCYLIKHVREHAEEYQIDPKRIAVIGFSAGGHLTASLGAYWNNPEIQALLDIENDENKPNGLILSYPVITGGEKAHKGSVKNLMGEDYTEQDVMTFSIENHVTEHFPKSFIWHTASDAGVPVENSLYLAAELAKHKVPFELKIYPYGPHGISLANELTYEQKEQLIVPRAQSWIREAISFLKEVAFCE